jgi:hypothetical protein
VSVVPPEEDWKNLPGNDALALKAAAFNLKKLEEGAASQATPAVRNSETLQQFLGSGYNASGLLQRSQGVAQGSRNSNRTKQITVTGRWIPSRSRIRSSTAAEHISEDP